jgi:hypothetical protein
LSRFCISAGGDDGEAEEREPLLIMLPLLFPYAVTSDTPLPPIRRGCPLWSLQPFMAGDVIGWTW